MKAVDQMIKTYGFPGSEYESKFCELWEIEKDFPWFPSKKIFINKHFKEMLVNSFGALQSKGIEGEIISYDGCLVIRNVRGKTVYSAHAWGAAIDLNASLNPMVSKKYSDINTSDRLGKWSDAFVNTMVSSGIYFGGYFKMRPDPMHFSMLDM